MAEMKDIQAWADRRGGGAVDGEGEPETGSEPVEPVDPETAITEASAELAEALTKITEAAQAFRDSGEDDQADKLDEVGAQAQAVIDALAELSGEVEAPDDEPVEGGEEDATEGGDAY